MDCLFALLGQAGTQRKTNANHSAFVQNKRKTNWPDARQTQTILISCKTNAKQTGLTQNKRKSFRFRARQTQTIFP
jgi:hypothetical protein